MSLNSFARRPSAIFTGSMRNAPRSSGAIAIFLSREFTAALDLFYRTAPAILGISAYINDPASVTFAREKYLRHWETMMQARFADDYSDSVASIYRLRNDFGINLQLSMGGRSFILARVLGSHCFAFAPQTLGFLRAATPGEAPTRLFARHHAGFAHHDGRLSRSRPRTSEPARSAISPNPSNMQSVISLGRCHSRRRRVAQHFGCADLVRRGNDKTVDGRGHRLPRVGSACPGRRLCNQPSVACDRRSQRPGP